MPSLEEIEEKIREIAGDEIEVVKVEPLGLAIAIYVKDISKIYQKPNFVKEVASSIKKKILVRSDPSQLLSEEKTKEFIKNLAGEEAGIKNIWFKPSVGEVVIEALKPGIVIGKEGSGLREIIINTCWSARVLRYPTMPSQILEGVRKSEIKYEKEIKKFLIKIGKRINRKLSSQTSWIRVVMLGAFREVGRSALLLQTNNSNVLIDCGINPATFDPAYAYPKLDMMGIPITELDAVVISHAHTDHVGFLPYLFKYGYDGPVYMTEPSKELTALLQKDYINIVKRYSEFEPPYSKEDIQKELRHIITVPLKEVVDITPEIKLTFYNAGHVLGSSVVHLHIGEGKHNLVYSGDIKFGFTQLFNPAETNFPRIETLFIESTYGKKTDVLPSRKERDEKLKQIIKETIEKKGSVLIPVFALGRSQELMLTLESFSNEEWFNVPVYIDGMVLEATAIHTAYPEYLRGGLQKRILSNNSPFEWDKIKVAKGNDRADIVNSGEPKIILAPSGMLTGGPSVDYLKLMAEDEKNAIIFVGYQSSLSLGYKIQHGVKEIPSVDEKGKLKTLKIKMRVETVEGFSGHSDRRQLLAWVKNLSYKPRRIFTMHGDYNKTEELARDIRKSFGIPSIAPFNMEAYRLR